MQLACTHVCVGKCACERVRGDGRPRVGVRSGVCGVGCTQMLLAVCPGELCKCVLCARYVHHHSVRGVGSVRMCRGPRVQARVVCRGWVYNTESVQRRGRVVAGVTGHGVQGIPVTWPCGLALTSRRLLG